MQSRFSAAFFVPGYWELSSLLAAVFALFSGFLCMVRSMDTFLLHGFNVRDGGARTVGRLVPYLPGARVVSYGWLGLIGVRFFNDNLARMLCSQLTPSCTVIGHSNAADVIWRALQLDACPRIKRLVLIRPALDSDVSFGDKVQRVDVFHHADDVPVGLSRLLLCHHWGSMGCDGYDGEDDEVYNWDEAVIFGKQFGGHSDDFNRNLPQFGNHLRRLLRVG